MNMKRDPYKHKQRFEKWIDLNGKQKRIEGMNEKNSKIFISFIKDFRVGLNVSNKSKKGERSFVRLNTLRGRLVYIIRKLEERGVEDIRKVKARELHNLFSDMRSGVLKTKYETAYKSTGDYVKVFKTFWHWHQKVMKNKGRKVLDITEDLDTRGEKPKFVYFSKNDFEKIIEKSSYDLKPIIALAFDSGARVTELMNVTVSDFSNDFKDLTIRDEVSKTFGRKMKLMICPEQLKKYIEKVELSKSDFICRLKPNEINKELRVIAKRVLSPDQLKFKNLTLKDFRHSSACFWLPRYKSESALKYRFGWKKSDMIHYYTELMGMKDTITADDMYIDISKTELEKDVDRLRAEIDVLKSNIKKLILVAEERKII